MKMKSKTPSVLTAGTTSKPSTRNVMNGKPVLTRAAKTVISDSGEFREKGLCDGPNSATFVAHTENVPPHKLRYLQYVSQATVGWWADQRAHGALPLGRNTFEG